MVYTYLCNIINIPPLLLSQKNMIEQIVCVGNNISSQFSHLYISTIKSITNKCIRMHTNKTNLFTNYFLIIHDYQKLT